MFADAPKARRAAGIALAVAALTAGTTATAWAQGGKGSYEGTIDVSGSQPELTYRARAKVRMPISDRSGSSINAEFLAGEAPNASVLVSQWDTFRRQKSADSGGHFGTTKCSLAAPAEIPMSSTGVLNVNLKKKTHAMSVTLLSVKDLAFNCVDSRSGPFKKKEGISLSMGTGVPGMHYETQLPFSDAGRLSARHTLGPGPETQGIVVKQEWDLRLSP